MANVYIKWMMCMVNVRIRTVVFCMILITCIILYRDHESFSGNQRGWYSRKTCHTLSVYLELNNFRNGSWEHQISIYTNTYIVHM